MSSSDPSVTRETGLRLEQTGVDFIDAPVSGGVKRAINGSLAIMAGGVSAVIARVKPLLSTMGKSIIETGMLGSGHAMKALNNYVSAAGLLAACEALKVGTDFGIAPDKIVAVLNASTGKNNSTENKMMQFIVSKLFNSIQPGTDAQGHRHRHRSGEKDGFQDAAGGSPAQIMEGRRGEAGRHGGPTAIFQMLDNG